MSDELEEEEETCKECNIPLVITADGTKCCPRCGLVVGKAHSWMASDAPRESNFWHQYEYLYEKRVERQRKLKEQGKSVW